MISKICQNLYCCSEADLDTLIENVTKVSVGDNVRPAPFHFPLNDQVIDPSIFQCAVSKIIDLLSSSNSVIVYCKSGWNRSVTVCVAVASIVTQKPLISTLYNVIRSRESNIQPSYLDHLNKLIRGSQR